MSLKTAPASLDLIHHIRQTTNQLNRNNVTRTQAYLDFYLRHPEIEWALLAHMVSRNGGYGMTDLRGDWLPRLMPEHELQAFFAFLERCNWLIFHDAYAQLLLYEQMKKTGEDLSFLIPSLHVSCFMEPIWRDFWQTRDSRKLTWALIINEQQYIEQRVVQHPFYQEEVLSTFAFQAQAVLSLNQVFFPYRDHPDDPYLKLIGLDVHHFRSLPKRIQVGKTLYHILFTDKPRLAKIVQFARTTPHTGSRADYWPHLFSKIRRPRKEGSRLEDYIERFDGDKLIPGRDKVYSPILTFAWKDTQQAPADGVDWFRDDKWFDALKDDPHLSTITEENVVDALNLVETGLKLVNVFT
ncbi:DUF2515 family protein [Brevibacillus dissolubilis]|uniref:DUF2515 family protein n=1 Tax=Brevibacillus dissolubilis TaxID=1844116 RepID=UPI0011173EA7|nr:DUF2515 family protein [Brevibacillus dissolubilis]